MKNAVKSFLPMKCSIKYYLINHFIRFNNSLIIYYEKFRLMKASDEKIVPWDCSAENEAVEEGFAKVWLNAAFS